MKRFALLGLAAVLVTGPGAAQTLLNDNFNTEHGGTSSLNYNTFANWTVGGRVDVVKSGDYGIICGGVCVDLDGSPGSGVLNSRQSFSFGSGDVMKITFAVGGNQRGGSADDFFMKLNFGHNTLLGPFLGTGGFSNVFGSSMTANNYNLQRTLASNVPFSTWSFQFQAVDAGAFDLALGTTSADNVGPLLDNVLVERMTSSIITPEPSTWAMLALGVGAIGIVSRRRSRKI